MSRWCDWCDHQRDDHEWSGCTQLDCDCISFMLDGGETDE